MVMVLTAPDIGGFIQRASGSSVGWFRTARARHRNVRLGRLSGGREWDIRHQAVL
jgi:hypothetical protein